MWLGRSQWTADSVANASWNELRIWDGVFTEVEVADSFARGVDLGGGPPSGELFQIIRIVAGAEVTITWNSEDGAAYLVEKKDALDAAMWDELEDSYPSQGVETSYTDNTIPAGTRERWYRVGKLAGQ
jgi:hypothetical protein